MVDDEEYKDPWEPRGPQSSGDLIAAQYLQGRLAEQFRTIQGADDRARVSVGFAFAILSVYIGGLLFVLGRGHTGFVTILSTAGIAAVGICTWGVLRNFSHVYNFSEWEYGPNTESVLDAAAGIRESDYVPQASDADVLNGASDEEVAQWLSGWLAFAWDENNDILTEKLRYVRKTMNWLIWQAASVGLALVLLATVLVLGLDEISPKSDQAVAGSTSTQLQIGPTATSGLPSVPVPAATAGVQ